MNAPQSHLQACHNCRRRRLKCDRSLPHCLKCITRGQDCLGYQRLFRWERGVASRGKMVGVRFETMSENQAKHERSASRLSRPAGFLIEQSSHEYAQIPQLGSLTDPLIQDLNHASREYLLYFANSVCRDLVLYDIPGHNPFRELIPLTHHHPVLLQIIIASSALHMSNACQKFLISDTTKLPFCHHTSLLKSPCLSSSAIQQPESYQDALVAKQRALHLLKSALTDIASANTDVILAAVLLFVEFELIDSGRDNWRYHIRGARTIIQTLCGTDLSIHAAISPLRKSLIANCLVFDFVGSTLACSTISVPIATFSTGALSLLQDAEGNHCSSFPIFLLHLVRAGAQLSRPDHLSSTLDPLTDSQQHQALLLLYTAQSFNPLAWASNIQARSPTTDLLHRTHIAAAHRAAVCIYLSRILLSFDSTAQLADNLESLVADIIAHLSLIRPGNALFKAIAWSAFIAGAETNDRARQEWVARTFEELWKVEPWGSIKGALGVLERIWEGKRGMGISEDESLPNGERGSGNWIGELRRSGVDWLIL